MCFRQTGTGLRRLLWKKEKDRNLRLTLLKLPGSKILGLKDCPYRINVIS